MATEAEDLRDAFAELGPELEELFMPQTCTVQRRTQTTDSVGAERATWRDHVTVRCLVGRSRVSEGATERLIAGREGELIVYRVTVPLGTDVDNLDRLRIDDGRLMEVRTVPKTSFQATIRMACVEVS